MTHLSGNPFAVAADDIAVAVDIAVPADDNAVAADTAVAADDIEPTTAHLAADGIAVAADLAVEANDTSAIFCDRAAPLFGIFPSCAFADACMERFAAKWLFGHLG